jgi:hypothetical protein
MRKIIAIFIVLLISSIWGSPAEASIARGGGGARPQVGNRSGGFSNVNRGSVNRGSVNRGSINRGVAGGSVDRNVAGVNRNVAGVNRNFNNVNVNNVNRNVDVHGWGNHYWVDDNHWGWGSFAAGAAAGAVTGAAVGAAVAPQTGTVVATLPPACTPVETGGAALYNCGGAYYQPAYQGSELVYQVVPQP